MNKLLRILQEAYQFIDECERENARPLLLLTICAGIFLGMGLFNRFVCSRGSDEYFHRRQTLYEKCSSIIDVAKDGNDKKDWGLAYQSIGKQFEEYTSNPRNDLDSTDLKKIINAYHWESDKR